MKGTYINTVIMQALLAGNRSRRTATNKEIITSLNDHKIIWSKDEKTRTKTISRNQAAIIN